MSTGIHHSGIPKMSTGIHHSGIPICPLGYTAVVSLYVHWNTPFTLKAALVYSTSLMHPDAPCILNAVLADSPFMQATLTDGASLWHICILRYRRYTPCVRVKFRAYLCIPVALCTRVDSKIHGASQDATEMHRLAWWHPGWAASRLDSASL